MLKSWLFLAGFVTLFTVGSIVHGNWTGRWTPLPPLEPYTEQLTRLPAVIGLWVSVDAPLDDPDSLAKAGIHGYFSKFYRHQQSNEQVSVLIVCGRPGPISVHTPDICYRSAGYVPTTEATSVDVSLPNKIVKVWQMNFSPPASRVGSPPLQIQWTWIGKNGVESPTNARLSFAFQPALYKVYLIREVVSNVSTKEAVAKTKRLQDQFAGEFLEKVEKTVLISTVLGNP
jgi:hypothetical protein